MKTNPVIYFVGMLVVSAILVYSYGFYSNPLKGVKPTKVSAFSSGDFSDIIPVYAQNCARCHGATGEGGLRNNAPPLQNIPLTQTQIIGTIQNGKGLMPAFSHLSQAELQRLAEFVKHL